MIGTFCWPTSKWIVPEFCRINWVSGLADPIVLGCIVLRNSWRGLQHRYEPAICHRSIGAATALPCLNTLFPSAGFGGEGRDCFFERGTALLTFYRTGPLPRKIFWGRTSETHPQVDETQPKLARVLRNGQEEEISRRELEPEATLLLVHARQSYSGGWPGQRLLLCMDESNRREPPVEKSWRPGRRDAEQDRRLWFKQPKLANTAWL